MHAFFFTLVTGQRQLYKHTHTREYVGGKGAAGEGPTYNSVQSSSSSSSIETASSPLSFAPSGFSFL